MSVSYPNQYRNYCVIDLPKRRNLDEIKTSLENPESEDTVIEDLYELNLMLDEGNKDVAKIYPALSKYNQTDSPNIQTFLAGIYRKIKVPDAFGPLIAMLIRNAVNPPQKAGFDANEEIGGAILDYLV